MRKLIITLLAVAALPVLSGCIVIATDGDEPERHATQNH